MGMATKTMATKTMATKMMATAGLAALVLGSATVQAISYDADPRFMQCMQSIMDEPSIPNEYGTDDSFPQDCGLVYPFSNIYNKEEVVIGEFIARSCGECAAACAASAGPAVLPESVMKTMGVAEQDQLGTILPGSYNNLCSDWVWCDPYEVDTGSYGSCYNKFDMQGEGADNTWPSDYRGVDPPYNGTDVADPFEPDNCLGRWREGSFEAYSTQVGQPAFLVGSQKGCRTSSGKVIPAGTCTLKSISSENFYDHIYSRYLDKDTQAFMSGMCQWTL